MIIEIGYTLKTDKNSPAVESWTYFYVKGTDLEKAITKAKTYWKKFCNELGWKPSQVKLNHIEAIKNGKTYLPEHIVVNKSELPPARKSRSTPSKNDTRASKRTVSSTSKTRRRRSV